MHDCLMPYTLWHCGVLLGASELQLNPERPRQMVGAFAPTAYGRELLPRLTGVLTAAAELKDELESRGVPEQEIQTGAVAELTGATAAEKKLVDIGRALSDVQLRAPNGASLAFVTIAFLDRTELHRLARKLHCDAAAATLETVPAGEQRFLVSVTLSPRGRAAPPSVAAHLS